MNPDDKAVACVQAFAPLADLMDAYVDHYFRASWGGPWVKIPTSTFVTLLEFPMEGERFLKVEKVPEKYDESFEGERH